jgi:hypothetical protein
MAGTAAFGAMAGGAFAGFEAVDHQMNAADNKALTSAAREQQCLNYAENHPDINRLSALSARAIEGCGIGYVDRFVTEHNQGNGIEPLVGDVFVSMPDTQALQADIGAKEYGANTLSDQDKFVYSVGGIGGAVVAFALAAELAAGYRSRRDWMPKVAGFAKRVSR